MGCSWRGADHIERLCRPVTFVPQLRIRRAATQPRRCRWLMGHQLDPPGPGFVPGLGFLPCRVQKQVGTEVCQTQSDRNFNTWGPHGDRDSSGAARGLPHVQPLIWEGQGPTGAQDEVIQLGAGVTTAGYFSGLQDSRVKAGSWFQHSLSAKSYRLFGIVRGQSLACPRFKQLTALHKTAVCGA